jgi:hemoglobin-like flavoprotein
VIIVTGFAARFRPLKQMKQKCLHDEMLVIPPIPRLCSLRCGGSSLQPPPSLGSKAVTPEQIRLVQTTWLKVLPLQDAAARYFYERLFAIDPSLRTMFPGDIQAQGQKLMQVIDAAVNGVGHFEQMMPVIDALGRRHLAYGVKDHHYGAVGAALLWTLGKALGTAFTPEARDAWAAFYGSLATTMRAGARAQTTTLPLAASAVKRPDEAAESPSGLFNRTHVVFAVTALALTAAIGLAMTLTVGGGRAIPSATASQSSPAVDPSRFILNSLLVPTLDAEAVPLRWTDPRPALRCGPDTAVYVNGQPLQAGAEVPAGPFELEWQADGCLYFSERGARVFGRTKLTVYREDWGFSAMVTPCNARIVSASHESTAIPAGPASTPAWVGGENVVHLKAAAASTVLPCR